MRFSVVGFFLYELHYVFGGGAGEDVGLIAG